MRTKQRHRVEAGFGYDLSISDLMAALCCIFILVTVAIVTSLKEKNSIANEYKETQVKLYEALYEEMKNDLDKWGATIDPETLTIRFSSDKGFASYKADLNPNYQKVLDEFFPKLIKVLKKDEFKKEIEEIRIEGFTAPDKADIDGEGSEHDYKEGLRLSQERTMNVLEYCLKTDYLSESDSLQEEKEWVRKHIVSNGYSLSRPIDENGNLIEDGRKLSDKEKAASRRVEFRIKTNSDNIVKQFQEINEGDKK